MLVAGLMLVSCAEIFDVVYEISLCFLCFERFKPTVLSGLFVCPCAGDQVHVCRPGQGICGVVHLCESPFGCLAIACLAIALFVCAHTCVCVCMTAAYGCTCDASTS